MAAPDRDDDDVTPADEASADEPARASEPDAPDGHDAGDPEGAGERSPAEQLSHEQLEPEDEGDGALPDEHVEEIDELGVEPHLDADAAREMADLESRLEFEEAIAGNDGDLLPEAAHEAGDDGDAMPRPHASIDDFVDADPAALDAAAGVSLAEEIAAAAGEEAGDAEEPKVDVVRRHLRGLLEALLFIAEKPMKVADLAEVARAEAKEVRAILEELALDYRASLRGFQLDELAGGWQLRTSPTFAPFVREMTAQKPVRLTRAQVETLAIIAYRQPITRPEVEDIRGVDGGAVMKLLLDRDLIRVLGKKDEPGRPLIYGTTTYFLTFFGLKTLRDLPTLREFTELTEESRDVIERELGEVLPEGPKEPVRVGDANVAAADFDPFAGEPHAEPEPAPDSTPEASASPAMPPETEPEPADEHEHEEAPEGESEDDVDDAEPQDAPSPQEKPGGAAYDPADEALFPDDDEDDDDDEDEGEEDDEEAGEDEPDE
jgi:segregation and condensation protein B